MKKLLLSSAAVVIGAAAIAAPAQAQVELGLGGHFKGYTVYHTQKDEYGLENERRFDILRTTEVHFTGETTLANGLTVGAHIEALIGGNRFNEDNNDGSNVTVDESYLYMSGAWGRVNFGNEDGAAYLLQVAAPSADSNIDGLRQFINPLNVSDAGYFSAAQAEYARKLDYAQDFTRGDDKITYLTPVFEGFQAGISYTPEVDGATRTFGVGDRDGDVGDLHHGWDLAARYEGQFDQFGLTLGGGFSGASQKESDDSTKSRRAWNLGGNVAVSAFNLGVVYTRDNNGLASDQDGNRTRQWVVGGDYTTGPFKLGVSYLNDKLRDAFGNNEDLKTQRYSGGVTYTYGPGMTFRGSIHHVRHKTPTGDANPKATSFLLGTQVNF